MSVCKGVQAPGVLWRKGASHKQATEGAFAPASGQPGGSPCPGWTAGRELTGRLGPCRLPAAWHTGAPAGPVSSASPDAPASPGWEPGSPHPQSLRRTSPTAPAAFLQITGQWPSAFRILLGGSGGNRWATCSCFSLRTGRPPGLRASHQDPLLPHPLSAGVCPGLQGPLLEGQCPTTMPDSSEIQCRQKQ